jgi:ribosomal protein S18 acetylase RimI-like enzyme
MRGTGGPLQTCVIVRDARPGELPLIGGLRVAAYRADGYLSAASTYADTLRSLGSDGAGDVLVAVEGPVIVGTVMLQPWPHAGEVVRGPGEAEIRALAVDPGARGRGTGRALVAAVTERAVHRGIGHLLLLTLPAMATAQRLYTKAGFRRLPARDVSPAPGVELLAFGRVLH